MAIACLRHSISAGVRGESPDLNSGVESAFFAAGGGVGGVGGLGGGTGPGRGAGGLGTRADAGRTCGTLRHVLGGALRQSFDGIGALVRGNFANYGAVDIMMSRIKAISYRRLTAFINYKYLEILKAKKEPGGSDETQQ